MSTFKGPSGEMIAGYNCSRTEPDPRVAEAQARNLQAEPMPEPKPCPKCDGSGQVAIRNEEGKIIGGSYCEDCKGTGAVL